MKKALIVIDYQVDFVNGTLGFDNAQKLEEIICEKITNYRNNNDDIIFTLDTHDDDYLNTLEGKSLPIKHCLAHTLGNELYGKVKKLKLESDKTFVKHTYGSLKLADYLEEKKFEKLEIVGLVSNICVLTNAVIARTALPNCEIIIDSKATDSHNKSLNEKALDVLEGLNIKVINRK